MSEYPSGGVVHKLKGENISPVVPNIFENIINQESVSQTVNQAEEIPSEVIELTDILMKMSGGNTLKAKKIFTGLKSRLILIIENDLNEALKEFGMLEDYIAERKSALEYLDPIK